MSEKKGSNYRGIIIGVALMMVYFIFIMPELMKYINPEQPAEQSKEDTASKDTAKDTPAKQDPKPEEKKTVSGPATPSEEGKTPKEAEKPAEKPVKKTADKEPAEENIFTIQNDKLEIEFTNVGGAIKSIVLLDYMAAPLPWEKPSEPLKILSPKDDKYLPFILSGLAKDESEGALTSNASLDTRKYFTEIDKENLKVVFTTVVSDSIRIRKIFDIPKDGYLINFEIEITNLDKTERSVKYELACASGIEREGDPSRPALAAVVAHQIPSEKMSLAEDNISSFSSEPDKKYSEEGTSRIRWAALKDRYFAAILRPLAGEDKGDEIGAAHALQYTYNKMIGDDAVDVPDLAVSLQSNSIKIPAGGKYNGKFEFYVGPLEYDALGADYEKVLNFGDWLGWISELLLFILNGLNYVFHNYGICILFLTIIIQVITHPLTKKQQISMHKIQKIAPQLKIMREKYKNDKNKLNSETWALYKKYGVNPFAGCWPMFIQIPIFIALYTALSQAIELRQAGFVWWIDDLSQPDAVLSLGNINLWLVQINSLNILPLLMTISMLIQQWMMPKPEDPQAQQQQKMLKFLPVIFLFILYNLPSGLCLYWTFRNILAIFEQKIIKKHLDTEEESVDVRKEKKE